MPKILAVAPHEISYSSLEGEDLSTEQIIGIDNRGKDILEWTALASEPWIILDQTSGETPANISIKVNPVGLAPGEHTGQVIISSPGTANTPQTIDIRFIVHQAATQTVHMDSGWQMISSFVAPENPNFETVLAQIVDQIVLVKNSKGEPFWPNYSIYQIGDWDPRECYQFYLTEPVDLTIDGYAINLEISAAALDPGWHMIGYWLDHELPVEMALATLLTDIVRVKNDNGEVYSPVMEISNLEYLVPGKVINCTLEITDV